MLRKCYDCNKNLIFKREEDDRKRSETFGKRSERSHLGPFFVLLYGHFETVRNGLLRKEKSG